MNVILRVLINKGNPYLRIEVIDTDSSAFCKFVSTSSTLEDGGNSQYTCFAYPQTCSMKLSSQWNFGRNRTPNLAASQCVSSRDLTMIKLWEWKRIFWQQHCAAMPWHLNFSH